MALTASDVEAYSLGRVAADTPGLDSVVQRAEAAVVAYCGWHIAPQVSETLVLDGSGTGLLQLPTKHVVAIDRVSLLGVDLEADLYDWSRVGLIQIRSPRGMFPRRYQSVEVDLTHGHESTPPDLETVVLGMAVRAAASPMGETSIRVGERASTFGAVGTSPLQDEYRVLDRYRVRMGA